MAGSSQREAAEHEARKGGNEQLAWRHPVAVRVAHIGLIGDLGLIVITVLGAAHARLAMAVRHPDEGGLAVGPLQGQQRADAAAPAAFTSEEHAAQECAGNRGGQKYARRPAVRIEDSDPALVIPKKSTKAITKPC